MLERLPKFIDPLLFADRGSELKGELGLTEFGRLADILANQSGKVGVQLSFFKEKKLAVVTGKINAKLELECQNCLEAMLWQGQCEFKLGMVGSIDEANLLPHGYEPMLIANEERIALSSLVEQELILSIPNFPKHDFNCLNLKQPENIESAEMDKTKSNNPFSVLAHLKKTGD